MTILNATKRSETGKASRTLLAEGKMPAVVYGPTHESEPITVSLADFTKILRDEGSSAVVEIAGLGTSFQAIIHDIDRDPVMSTPRHADLYAITKGAKVTVAVPISFVGESPVAKEGGSIVKVMHELEVEADPSKLPQEIEVDLSLLAALGDQVHVRDIKLPAGVAATVDGDEVIVLAQAVEEEAEASAGPDMSAIEVEQKGKSEEAEEAGE